MSVSRKIAFRGALACFHHAPNRYNGLVKRYLYWLIAAVLLIFGVGTVLYRTFIGGRNKLVWQFLLQPESNQSLVQEAGTQCPGAPFSLPTRGYIGYLWHDRFKLFTPHQGLDIFSGEEPGKTPVYAPYDAYLSRRADWKSTLVLRIPQDPLQPERQIWVYMTHLADAEGESLINPAFAPGCQEIPVKRGDFLGYQGNYSGNPSRPVGVHLHISLVKDDGQGWISNELKIENTLDPSKYFGMQLDARKAKPGAPYCFEDD